jgi:hypothetical protein
VVWARTRSSRATPSTGWSGPPWISRNRIATPGAAPPVRLFNLLVMESGSLVMERKMLLGIKQRAKNLGQDTSR